MLDWIIGIIVFIIVLSLIIIIHEGGHFFFAKKAGILCYEFSVGMGPVVCQKRKNETVYSLRAIPLGGFVSMSGEEIEQDMLKDAKKVKLEFIDGKVSKIYLNPDFKDTKNKKKAIAYQNKIADLEEYELVSYDILGTQEAKEDELYLEVKTINEADPRLEETMKFVVLRDALLSFSPKEEIQISPVNRNFASKSLGKRFMAVFAGPMMNFILAWVVFVVMGLIGGYANMNSTKVDNVVPTTPAEVAGIKDGDKITSLGSYTGKLEKWDDISKAMGFIASGKDETFDGSILVTYERGGESFSTKAYPQTVIYAMEMVLKSQDANGNSNLPLVGTYNDEATNKKTIAYRAGLVDGDLITNIKILSTNESIPVSTKNDVLKFFAEYDRANKKGADIEITVLRTKEDKTEEVKCLVETYSQGLLESQGITPTKVQLGISPTTHFDFLQLLYQPFVQVGKASLLVFDTLKLLFTDKTVNLNDLSGPIGILSIIKSATSQGLLSVLNWMAIISVNVGLINLLPLPALDGGRLAFLLYEAITKKKPSPKVENTIHNIGFILLMALFAYVFFNDILRLFR